MDETKDFYSCQDSWCLMEGTGTPQSLPSFPESLLEYCLWVRICDTEDPMTGSVSVACQWALQVEPPLCALVQLCFGGFPDEER